MKKRKITKNLRAFYRSFFSDNDFYLKFYNKDDGTFELVGLSGIKFFQLPNIYGLSYDERLKIFNDWVAMFDDCGLCDFSYVMQNKIIKLDKHMKRFNKLKFDIPVICNSKIISYSLNDIISRIQVGR